VLEDALLGGREPGVSGVEGALDDSEIDRRQRIGMPREASDEIELAHRMRIVVVVRRHVGEEAELPVGERARLLRQACLSEPLGQSENVGVRLGHCGVVDIEATLDPDELTPEALLERGRDRLGLRRVAHRFELGRGFFAGLIRHQRLGELLENEIERLAHRRVLRGWVLERAGDPDQRQLERPFPVRDGRDGAAIERLEDGPRGGDQRRRPRGLGARLRSFDLGEVERILDDRQRDVDAPDPEKSHPLGIRSEHLAERAVARSEVGRVLRQVLVGDDDDVRGDERREPLDGDVLEDRLRQATRLARKDAVIDEAHER
jgi:hypothetical protein